MSNAACTVRSGSSVERSLECLASAVQQIEDPAAYACAVRNPGAPQCRDLLYVADASAYGSTGPRPVTEDAPPRPSARGRCLTPALEPRGYIASGLPIVTAFPGWVYGNGSWFRQR